MFINKNVEYHSVSTHEVYKLFTYTQATYSGSGLTINDAIAPPSNIEAQLEQTSSYNHFFLRHWFYSLYNNTSFSSFKTSYSNQNNYVLQENARFISVPLKSFGKRILQSSISIVDTSTGSINIIDDGKGNLIDTSISTGSFVSTNNLLCWVSFDDGYKIKQYPYANPLKLKDNSSLLLPLNVVNATSFTSGLSGSGYQINLSVNGYAYINDTHFFDFNKQDFTLSFWVKIPSTQFVQSTTTNTIISKRYSLEDQYPFEIKVFNSTDVTNNGRLYVSRKGYKDSVALQPISFTSSAILNNSNYHHVVLKKVSGSLKLYVNGTLDSSVSDYSGRYDTSNSSKIYIGATCDTLESVITHSYFSGSIDELRIYRGDISETSLYNYPFNTNVIGSVFYEKGIIVLNNLSGSYANILKSNFTLTYRSVSEITEHEISFVKGINEFNSTMNKSLRVDGSLIPNNNISSSLISGIFTPYFTGIGLYNDEGQLLAVAKIKQPIKSIKDLNVYFKVRFDV